MSGFRFRLFSDDWDELGEIETIVPNWSVGDEFLTGDGRRFLITGIVPVDDDVGIYNALWKVEPVNWARSQTKALPGLTQTASRAPTGSSRCEARRLRDAAAPLNLVVFAYGSAR